MATRNAGQCNAVNFWSKLMRNVMNYFNFITVKVTIDFEFRDAKIRKFLALI